MKINLSARFLMLALLCGSCVLNTPKEELEYNGMNTLQISNVDDLISFYQYADDRIPLISRQMLLHPSQNCGFWELLPST